jgi:DNA-binding transcriptional LysR family regulator
VVAACWFTDRVVNLLDEGADIGIRIGELPDSSMQAVSVGRVRRVVCAAPGYLERHGTPLAPADLLSHTLVSASAVTPNPEWRFIRNNEPCVVKLQPRMTTTSNDSALAAALAGFGITRLLSYQVAEFVKDGRLKPLLEEFDLPAMPVHVVHREGQHASRKARAFIDLVVERLRNHPALG